VWLQYMSHKVGRLIVPWALVALLVSSVALTREGWLYSLALTAQAGFYALAAFGAWLEARDRQTGRRFAAKLPVAIGKEAR
jgi:biofilm PGA synthesis N-glycosyltransferase PgaC